MQITLNHDEILEALDAYVRTQIAIAPGQQVAIDLKAGRGENGFSATLDIVPAKAAPVAESFAATCSAPVNAVTTKPAAATQKTNPFGKIGAAAKAASLTQVEPAEEAPETPEEPIQEELATEELEEDTEANEEAGEAPEPTPTAPVKRSIFSQVKAG